MERRHPNKNIITDNNNDDQNDGVGNHLNGMNFEGHYDEAFYNFQQSLKAAARAGLEMPFPGPAEKCAYIAR